MKKCCGTCRFREYSGQCEYEPTLPFWANDFEFKSEGCGGRYLADDDGEDCDAYEEEIDWYVKMDE